jgi:hypothetical protein
MTRAHNTRSYCFKSLAVLALATLAVAGACDRSPNDIPPPAAAVEVYPGTAALVAGESTRLTARVKDASGREITGRVIEWSSSDLQVARVASTGRVSALRHGTVTITARSEGKQGTATLAIHPDVQWMSVVPHEFTLRVQMAQDLALQVRNSRGELVSDVPVSWTSSDTTIATVSAVGRVTAKQPGPVVITAAVAGKSATASVQVIPDSRFQHQISFDATLANGLRVVVGIRGELLITSSVFNGQEWVVGSGAMHYEHLAYHHPDPACSVQVVETHHGGSYVELRTNHPRGAAGKLAGGLFPARAYPPREVIRTECAGQAPVTEEHTHVADIVNALFAEQLITDFEVDASGNRYKQYDRTVTTAVGTIREASSYLLRD